MWFYMSMKFDFLIWGQNMRRVFITEKWEVVHNRELHLIL